MDDEERAAPQGAGEEARRITPAIVPVRSQQVAFQGDSLLAVQVEDGTVYVVMRPISEALGLSWASQFRRLRRDPILADELRFVAIMETNPQGGDPETLCLPLKLLPGWLFGVQPSRVKPELREKILRYQRDCYEVLWQAFQADVMVSTELAAYPSSTAALIQIRETALAIARLAEQQLALETRLDRAAQVVGDLQRRLTKVERRLDPASVVTDEQAAAISNQVKALAALMTSYDPSKNHYQGIFGELYRRFGVYDYKHIRQEQYDAAIQFLADWQAAFLAGRAESDGDGESAV